VTVQIEILDDPDLACAELLVEAARSGGHMVLTGGSGPQAAYAHGAQQAEAWAGARLWFTDERCVPPEDEVSNFGAVKAALLDPVAAAGVEIGFCRRMLGELGPERGALDYEQALAELGELGSPTQISFELMLVGLGPDAHICSMFPGQDSLRERERLVVGVPVSGMEPFVPRVTLTFPAISRARVVVLLAKGASKADAIARGFADNARPSLDAPVSLIAEHADNIRVLLDSEAGSRL
jgi:6-phosphogluconolactonase